MGTMVGLTLYVGARWRRHVVLQNLRVCFPEKSESKRQEIAKQTFVYFAQAWFDRSWLWHRSPSCIQARVRFTGFIDELKAFVKAVPFEIYYHAIQIWHVFWINKHTHTI